MTELCTNEKCVAVVQCETRLTNMEGWQKSQNGTIHRVESKVDKLIWMIMGALGMTALNLFLFLMKK